jgi:hypothetical protein
MNLGCGACGACGSGCGACGACGSGCGGCGSGCGGCGSSSGGSDESSHIGTYDPMYQHYTMIIPRNPVVKDPTPMEDDIVGIMSNGVLLDSHRQTWAYDVCNGHSDRKHQYHYHIPPICFMESMGVDFADTAGWWINDEGNATRDYDELAAQFPASGPPSPVIGFARDGFPIFGPYDDQGLLMRGALFSNDTGLDMCNGKIDSAGMYGYYMTVDPPFAPPCLRGDVGVFAYYTTNFKCPKDGIENTIVPESDSDTVVISRGSGDGRALRGVAEFVLQGVN